MSYSFVSAKPFDEMLVVSMKLCLLSSLTTELIFCISIASNASSPVFFSGLVSYISYVLSVLLISAPRPIIMLKVSGNFDSEPSLN